MDGFSGANIKIHPKGDFQVPGNGMIIMTHNLYAIYSRSVLEILRIERGRNDVEEYRKYVEEMRILRKAFWVDKTADVDKIVWVISRLKGMHGAGLKKILAEYLPENLTREELVVYLSHAPLKIAKVYLKQKDHMTAGLWAAKAFDKFLEDECRNHGILGSEQAHRRSPMIKELCERTLLWRKPHNRKWPHGGKCQEELQELDPATAGSGWGEP